MMENKIEYQLIRSGRRTLAVEITSDGAVVVRAPDHCPKQLIENFLKEKEGWVLKKCAIQKERTQLAGKSRRLTEKERSLYREKAGEVIWERALYYANVMGVSFERITIREQKSRWGSCSGMGNLNFNWKLILAPAGVLDYVVVHELAHRKQMNHSSAFWCLVEEFMPDYRVYKNWLRENGSILLAL